MTDADRPDDLADGEVLAAYLDGATDEVTTARLERRLAADPALAARLDELAAVRARLQRLSQVTAPDDVRRRLRDRLAEDREAAVAPTRQTDDGRATRRRRWMAATAPRLAVAVVVLLAVLVLGTAALQLLGGVGASDSGGSAALGASEPAVAADPAAGGEAAPDRAAGAGDAQQEAATSGGAGPAGSAGSEPAVAAAPDVPSVERDQQLIARARRQQQRTPRELRAREQRLRRRAGLPTDRLCVSDLDARTVDLVERDGHLVLAALLGPADAQIVLVDPRTCAPQRTIPLSP